MVTRPHYWTLEAPNGRFWASRGMDGVFSVGTRQVDPQFLNIRPLLETLKIVSERRNATMVCKMIET